MFHRAVVRVMVAPLCTLVFSGYLLILSIDTGSVHVLSVSSRDRLLVSSDLDYVLRLRLR